MKKTVIVACILMIVGLLLGGTGMALLGFDFTKLNMAAMKSRTFRVEEPFTAIDIQDDCADIRILLSQDGETRVECKDLEKIEHTVKVENGTLILRQKDTRKWYQRIGVFWAQTQVTVYLPQAQYESLKVSLSTGDVEVSEGFELDSVNIKGSTGNVTLKGVTASGHVQVRVSTGFVRLENVAAGSLSVESSTGDAEAKSVAVSGQTAVKVETGKVRLMSVQTQSLSVESSTGDVVLERVTVQGHAEIEADTGDVKLSGFGAQSATIETDTGDVTGTVVSAKQFEAETDTGKVKVPASGGDGMFRITTDTGDIKISLE